MGMGRDYVPHFLSDPPPKRKRSKKKKPSLAKQINDEQAFKNHRDTFLALPGDKVRLKTGHAGQIVTAAYLDNRQRPVFDTEYLSSEHVNFCRPQSHFELYRGSEEPKPREEKGPQMATEQLYEVPGKTTKSKTRFGKYLATTGGGEIVVEINGKAESFKKDDVKKVVPWTFTVKYSDTRSNMRFKGPEGCVSKGDILINDEGVFAIVTQTNTQSNQDCGEFKGRKVATTDLATL